MRKDTFITALDRVRRTYGLRGSDTWSCPNRSISCLASRIETASPSRSSLSSRESHAGLSAQQNTSGRNAIATSTSEITISCREAALYSSQSGKAGTVRRARRLGVEQLPPLCNRSRRTGGDRIGMDGKKARSSSRTALSSHQTIPLKPTPGLSGAPGSTGWRGSRGSGRDSIMSTPESKALFPIFERTGTTPRQFRAGFMDRSGRTVVSPIYDNARPFHCGLAPVKSGKSWGALDGSGNLAIPAIADVPVRVSEDRVVYTQNGKRGIMTTDGKIVVQPLYRILVEFQEGASWMSANDLYGFVGPDGEQIAPAIYEDARSFSEGLAPVKFGGKWGYISKSLAFRIPPQFDFALPFSEGIARVQQDGLWGTLIKRAAQLFRCDMRMRAISTRD